MMVGEIVAGTLFGSVALLADGWHMATHAAALGIAALAYTFARQHSGNSRFAFGTRKFGDLAAFSSAIILAMIAVQIAYESVVRLTHPVSIAYGEAIAVRCWDSSSTSPALVAMRTLPGLRTALIMPGGSVLDRIRCGLQT